MSRWEVKIYANFTSALVAKTLWFLLFNKNLEKFGVVSFYFLAWSPGETLLLNDWEKNYLPLCADVALGIAGICEDAALTLHSENN